MPDLGQDTFKGISEIYNSGLRLLGAAHATGALEAGAAFQAFDKRPELQSSIKIILGFFFAGIVTFTISQMAMILMQLSMSNYFRRQNERSEWETIFSDGKNLTSIKDYLRITRQNLIIIGLNGFAVAGACARGPRSRSEAGGVGSRRRHVPVTREKDHPDDTPA
jgi:hypothetical protein